MNLLTYTTLYPNAVNPQHGIFVENRLRRIVATGDAAARVVAPVPWFPFKSDIFGAYGAFARIGPSEVRFGIAVDHPRYLSIPRVGMGIAPGLLARATVGRVRRHVAETGAQLIDAHYFYPDGVAAAAIGKALDMPVVITARGSDVNLIAQYDGPRRQTSSGPAASQRSTGRPVGTKPRSRAQRRPAANPGSTPVSTVPAPSRMNRARRPIARR